MGLDKYKKRNEIRRQIGRANKRLEVNKIVSRFRDVFNNASKEEQAEIMSKIMHIKQSKNDILLFKFLTALGLTSGSLSIYHIIKGDVDYLLFAVAGIALGVAEAIKTVDSIEEHADSKKSFLEYFKDKTREQPNVIAEMEEQCPKHKLTGDNAKQLEEQITSDACDDYIKSVYY